jgi:hypothetical protein
VKEGFKYYFPSQCCLNVWSVPNYEYSQNNLAAIFPITPNMELKKVKEEFLIFKSVGIEEKNHKFSNLLPYFL